MALPSYAYVLLSPRRASNVAGSTMYPSVSYCDNGPASLSSDDNAAENDLY